MKTPFQLPTEGGRYVADPKTGNLTRVSDEDSGPGAPVTAEPEPPTAPPSAIEKPRKD